MGYLVVLDRSERVGGENVHIPTMLPATLFPNER